MFSGTFSDLCASFDIFFSFINAIRKKEKQVSMNKQNLSYDVIKTQIFTKLNLESRNYNKCYKNAFKRCCILMQI